MLADLYAQGALQRTPYSALPDAPVQPYVEPRRRLRRLLATLASTPRRLPSLPITVGTPNAPRRSRNEQMQARIGLMSRVTLQTIADRVGVSRMTVSNAFSRPDQLSPELRRRILSAADDLGYVGPDPAARALARGRTGAVGVLLTDSLRDAFSDEVATTFLGAIADELEPSGLALTLLSSGRGDIVPARDVPMDGAFVYSCDTELAQRRLADAPQTPARLRRPRAG